MVTCTLQYLKEQLENEGYVCEEQHSGNLLAVNHSRYPILVIANDVHYFCEVNGWALSNLNDALIESRKRQI